MIHLKVPKASRVARPSDTSLRGCGFVLKRLDVSLWTSWTPGPLLGASDVDLANALEGPVQLQHGTLTDNPREPIEHDKAVMIGRSSFLGGDAKETRVAISRMRKGSRGWKLVR